MPLLREFLDWNKPGLATAAEYLLKRFRREQEFDLSGVLVVVPGGRAGRRLLEILVSLSEQHGLVLTPPAIVTPEGFPETLYLAKWPFANTLTQRLAWVQAMLDTPAKVLRAVLPKPPAKDDMPAWLAVGETFRRLHLELAADGLDCRRVLEGASKVQGFTEHERWKALCELQRRYLNVLDGLHLWDVQTARLVAIEKREIATDRQVVLIGTADLNRAQQDMLDQISDSVTALIVAPPALASRFDEYGCLIPGKWTDATLPLEDEQIERVDGPADQAQAAVQWLARLNAQFRADEIVIGVPDERLVPHLERQLAQCGVSGRWAIGKQLAETGPYRLLKAAADYASRGRFRDMVALVRHPDVYDWLVASLSAQHGRTPDILGTLDRWAIDRCPASIDAARLDSEDQADLLAICTLVDELVAPLAKGKAPLRDWNELLADVLVAIYGKRMLDRDRTTDRYLSKTLEMTRAALDALSRVPDALQPTADAREACGLVLADLAGEGIPPSASSDAIELLGWLDLPLDDAPATLVTTFNEGFVPGSITADAYLPNRLREALGLVHNDRRLARDAYALSVLCASRKKLHVLVARRDCDDNPLAPSRLLFMTDEERLIRRGCAFFGPLPPQPSRPLLLGFGTKPLAGSRLELPRPRKLDKPITELGVTQFRDYIACPYRFYLRHALKLEALVDDVAELDGGSFGWLVHWVLEQFGRTDEAADLRQSRDEDKIAAYLAYKLDQVAAGRYGPHLARPAVLVQLEQIRLRLQAFARWQASRTREGWRIVFCENSERREKLTADFSVDDIPFTLSGRIDRVDYHEGKKRLAVLDYKTADRGEDPHRTHRYRDEWIDLQLPLYRHLVRKAKLDFGVATDTAIEMGYIVLPVDLKATGLKLAEWDDALLLSADQRAMEVVRGLREERFWPPTSPPPSFCEDLAAICQDRRMGGAKNEEGAAA